MITKVAPTAGALRAAQTIFAHMPKDDPKVLATAELIDRETAAPEMLEVLELLHRLTLQTPALANDPDSREVMDRAWMVIHKAKGE